MDTIFIPDDTPLRRVLGLPAIVGPHARVLILGSMPGTLSLQRCEYYAAPGNRFWRVLASLLGVDLPQAYADRVSMLEHAGIALWDVLASCLRWGAKDSSIQEGVANDLPLFCGAHTQLETIALNGKKAAELFHTLVPPEVSAGLRILSLPSTSAANARVNPQSLAQAWSEILA